MYLCESLYLYVLTSAYVCMHTSEKDCHLIMALSNEFIVRECAPFRGHLSKESSPKIIETTKQDAE